MIVVGTGIIHRYGRVISQNITLFEDIKHTDTVR